MVDHSSTYEVAAELAARQARDPASLKQAILDCIYNLSESDLLFYQKVEECRVEGE
jgi:hydroxyethylthiazole kinase-like sugar kinase family protein